MSGTSGTIVELEGDPASPPGQDRRRALLLAFTLCLAVGSAGVGRDGPEATQPSRPVAGRPAGTADLVGFRVYGGSTSHAMAPIPLTTHIYDRAGEHLLYTLADERRDLISPVNVILLPVRVRPSSGGATDDPRGGSYLDRAPVR